MEDQPPKARKKHSLHQVAGLSGLPLHETAVLANLSLTIQHTLTGLVPHDLPLGEWVLICHHVIKVYREVGERAALDAGLIGFARKVCENHRLVTPEQEKIALDYMRLVQSLGDVAPAESE